jgi:hypothetical protein
VVVDSVVVASIVVAGVVASVLAVVGSAVGMSVVVASVGLSGDGVDSACGSTDGESVAVVESGTAAFVDNVVEGITVVFASVDVDVSS